MAIEEAQQASAANYVALLVADSNGVPDDARVCAMFVVLSYCALTAYSVIVAGQAFDAQQFGIGACALAAGVGGWFRLRGAQ